VRAVHLGAVIVGPLASLVVLHCVLRRLVVYPSHTASNPLRSTVRSPVAAPAVSEGIHHRTFVTPFGPSYPSPKRVSIQQRQTNTARRRPSLPLRLREGQRRPDSPSLLVAVRSASVALGPALARYSRRGCGRAAAKWRIGSLSGIVRATCERCMSESVRRSDVVFTRAALRRPTLGLAGPSAAYPGRRLRSSSVI
jgi:hypothetical protein